MAEKEISCRTCCAFFYEDPNGRSVYGYCHRWPPAPTYNQAVWPRVYELDFCLEHAEIPDE